MSTMALEVKSLESWYGESHILHGVNFAVRDGEVVTLLGRNGAGRTTILKTILGLTSKRAGSVEVYGSQTIAMPTYKIARLGWLLSRRTWNFCELKRRRELIAFARDRPWRHGLG